MIYKNQPFLQKLAKNSQIFIFEFEIKITQNKSYNPHLISYFAQLYDNPFMIYRNQPFFVKISQKQPDFYFSSFRIW